MTFWEFWSEHYILAFFALILFFGSINTVAKYLAILFRGWPKDEDF